jgi:hypothetical protein
VAGDQSRTSGAIVTNNGLAGILAGVGLIAEDAVVARNGFSTNACGSQGSGGAAYQGVVITASQGGNRATACGMVNLGGNSCQGVACPP